MHLQFGAGPGKHVGFEDHALIHIEPERQAVVQKGFLHAQLQRIQVLGPEELAVHQHTGTIVNTRQQVGAPHAVGITGLGQERTVLSISLPQIQRLLCLPAAQAGLGGAFPPAQSVFGQLTPERAAVNGGIRHLHHAQNVGHAAGWFLPLERLGRGELLCGESAAAAPITAGAQPQGRKATLPIARHPLSQGPLAYPDLSAIGQAMDLCHHLPPPGCAFLRGAEGIDQGRYHGIAEERHHLAGIFMGDLMHGLLPPVA